jgi:predicted O-methyltransferase YrrM
MRRTAIGTLPHARQWARAPCQSDTTGAASWEDALTKFDEVTRRFGDIKFMREDRAAFLRDFVVAHDLRDLLEVGFYQGKSSAYIGAILEDRGGPGHLLTIDRVGSRAGSPGIGDLLGALELTHRVTPVRAERSYTWELARMIRDGKRDLFDFCYFDGGHTWDATGFGFVLVDMVLRPGGWIIFDDLEWTIDKMLAKREGKGATYEKYSADERQTKNVRLVFDTLVPHLGYQELSEAPQFQWGIARKPLTR